MRPTISTFVVVGLTACLGFQSCQAQGFENTIRLNRNITLENVLMVYGTPDSGVGPVVVDPIAGSLSGSSSFMTNHTGDSTQPYTLLATYLDASGGEHIAIALDPSQAVERAGLSFEVSFPDFITAGYSYAQLMSSIDTYGTTKDGTIPLGFYNSENSLMDNPISTEIILGFSDGATIGSLNPQAVPAPNYSLYLLTIPWLFARRIRKGRQPIVIRL